MAAVALDHFRELVQIVWRELRIAGELATSHRYRVLRFDVHSIAVGSVQEFRGGGAMRSADVVDVSGAEYAYILIQKFKRHAASGQRIDILPADAAQLDFLAVDQHLPADDLHFAEADLPDHRFESRTAFLNSGLQRVEIGMFGIPLHGRGYRNFDNTFRGFTAEIDGGRLQGNRPTLRVLQGEMNLAACAFVEAHRDPDFQHSVVVVPVQHRLDVESGDIILRQRHQPDTAQNATAVITRWPFVCVGGSHRDPSFLARHNVVCDVAAPGGEPAEMVPKIDAVDPCLRLTRHPIELKEYPFAGKRILLQ